MARKKKQQPLVVSQDAEGRPMLPDHEMMLGFMARARYEYRALDAYINEEWDIKIEKCIMATERVLLELQRAKMYDDKKD